MHINKVNLIIIGAPKAGTTSLARWLSKVSNCCMSDPKETMYFAKDDLYGKNNDWYHSRFFAHYSGEKIVGEATPSYSDRDNYPETARRVHEYNPEAKIIYMVRDPLDRCISEWRMWHSIDPSTKGYGGHLIKAAQRGFNEWLSDPVVFDNEVKLSSYYSQLGAWDCFPRSQQLVIFLEDLASEKSRCLEEIARFLNLDSEELKAASSQRYNTGKSRTTKTKLRKLVEGTWLWRKVKGFVPAGIKAMLADSSIGSKSTQFTKEQIDSDLKAKFLNEVRKDSLLILAENNKPPDFWCLNPVNRQAIN